MGYFIFGSSLTLIAVVFLFVALLACGSKSTTPTQVDEATSSPTFVSSEREEAQPTTSSGTTDNPGSLTEDPSVEVTPTSSTESDLVDSTPDRSPNDTDNIFIIELPAPFDSPRIVFTSDDGDLRVMKPDGSDIVRLTFEAGPSPMTGFYRQPTWAPDRQRIAFVSAGEPAPAVDGARITQLTFDGADHPAWSPNGTRIIFDYEGKIYTINPDGTHLVRLTGIEGNEPTWSPDSRHLAFTWYGELYVTSVDDSQVKHLQLDTSQSACPAMDVNAPVWSPDGRIIAFHSHPDCVRGTGISIYTVDMDTLMLSDPAGLSYQSPDWSPDSKYIVFDSHREISIMSFPDGENPIDNYIQGYPGAEPVWSP